MGSAESGPDTFSLREWFKGTALRPLLAALEPEQQAEFLQELGNRLKTAYPATGGVALLPFPRLFFVATRHDHVVRPAALLA